MTLTERAIKEVEKETARIQGKCHNVMARAAARCEALGEKIKAVQNEAARQCAEISASIKENEYFRYLNQNK